MSENKQSFTSSLILWVGGFATGVLLAPHIRDTYVLEQAQAIQRANPDFRIWIELHKNGETEIMGAPK